MEATSTVAMLKQTKPEPASVALLYADDAIVQEGRAAGLLDDPELQRAYLGI